jgi:hypothetical protein
MRKIMRLCVDAGGSVTGEHGIGLDKLEYMPTHLLRGDAGGDVPASRRVSIRTGDRIPARSFPYDRVVSGLGFPLPRSRARDAGPEARVPYDSSHTQRHSPYPHVRSEIDQARSPTPCAPRIMSRLLSASVGRGTWLDAGQPVAIASNSLDLSGASPASRSTCRRPHPHRTGRDDSCRNRGRDSNARTVAATGSLRRTAEAR